MNIGKWLCQFARTLIRLRQSGASLPDRAVKAVKAIFIRSEKGSARRVVLYARCGLIAIFLFPLLSNAATYKWRGNVIELYASLDEACQVDYQNLLNEVSALNQNGCQYATTLDLCEKDIVGTDPPSSASDVGKSTVHFTLTTPFPACGTTSPAYLVRPQHVYHGELVPDSFYITTSAQAPAQCGPTCNGVDDPINPASGAVYDTIIDISPTGSSLAFNQFYNSTDGGSTNLSGGWRHSYGRSVQANNNSVALQPYVASPNNSSLYADQATACTSGFAEIKSRVSTWANALASYGNGVCVLTQGGTNIGTVAVLSAGSSLPAANANPVSFDATRDDGQVVRFTVQGGVITAPPTINMKLQQTSNGYTLTDANDSVETYDANGKLLVVTNRSGVVQTMSYDASGRLSGVTDSFGHQLTLGYDAQNRLITVTRQ